MGKNLLCNWSACGEGKLRALIHELEKVWGQSAPEHKTFYDLGCGDGRVVLEVCRTFPACTGVGIDMNTHLVQEANRRAKQMCLQDRCRFRVGDITKASLRDANAVFLYFPPGALDT